jgi:hypothetical protein
MNLTKQLAPLAVGNEHLSRKAFIAALAVVSLVGTTRAQQINFGGLTWDTVQREHRDHPGVYNVFTATGADSATIRGVYNGGDAGDSVMTTTLPALTPGSTVAFDFYLSNNGNNIPDFNGGNWFGDLGFVFQTTPTVPNFQNWATDRVVTTWANHRDEVKIGGNLINDGTDLLAGGVHALWTFNGSDYSVTLTSLVNGTTTTSFTGGYWGTGLADVHAMRIALYDSEQTLTIDNFTVSVAVPEPGSLTLLALGAAGMTWAWRRR